MFCNMMDMARGGQVGLGQEGLPVHFVAARRWNLAVGGTHGPSQHRIRRCATAEHYGGCNRQTAYLFVGPAGLVRFSRRAATEGCLAPEFRGLYPRLNSIVALRLPTHERRARNAQRPIFPTARCARPDHTSFLAFHEYGHANRSCKPLPFHVHKSGT